MPRLIYGVGNGCQRSGIGDDGGMHSDVLALILSGPMFPCCMSTRAQRTTRVAAAVDKSVIALTTLSTASGRGHW